MALRKASASARSLSALSRRRMSFPIKASTDSRAVARNATSAVSKLGNKSGAARQLSTRSTSVVAGRSINWRAVKTRLPRRTDPRRASRVPSPSVKDIS